MYPAARIRGFGRFRAGGDSAAAIRALFAAGEQGAWYDPSDLSSMYQESTGITPAAIGQPVGLMLDKRLGLVRGANVVTNGDFSGGTTGWRFVDSSGGIENPSMGTVTDGVLTVTGATSPRAASAQITGLVVGKTYEVTAQLLSATAIPFLTVAAANDLTSIYQQDTASSTPRNARLVWTASATTAYVGFRSNSAGSFSCDEFAFREIPGNHASQSTSASRPTLQQDASGYYYLSFDGFDDGMVTSAIDFTGTDKMTVWAGVNKQSDAAIGMVLEHGVGGVDALAASLVNAPRTIGGSGNYGTDLRAGGLVSTGQTAAAPAPNSSVFAVSLNYAGTTIAEEVAVRLNGVANSIPSGTGPLASAGFGNYPLYLGRRGGASLPFNGRFYSLIVRGAASDSAQISAGERYAAGKQGITL